MLYAATLIYLALVYVRPTELITGLDGVPVILIASVIVTPLLAVRIMRRPRRLFELPQDRFLFGYWAAIVLSNLAWGWLGGGLYGFTTFGQVVFQYVMIRAAIEEPRHLRGIIVLLAAAMTFHAVSGIVQHVTGLGFGGVTPIMSEEQTRIRSVGIFNDPNDLALSLLMMVPFLIAAMLGSGVGLVSRVLAAGALAPILYALYLTNSRGGVIGLAAALAVYGWRRYGIAAGSVVVAASLVGLIALGPSRLSEIDADEDSAQGRVQAWSEGLQMLKSRPLTGVGFSMFTEYHPLVAHNSFVHAFAELGVLGGGCFVGMVYWYFESLRRVATRRRQAPSRLALWHDAMVASGAGFFVSVCFLSRQYMPTSYTLLALGASYAMASQGEESSWFAVSRTDRLRVLALTIFTIVLLWVIVRTFAVWGEA